MPGKIAARRAYLWTLVATTWGVVSVAGQQDDLLFVGYPRDDESAAIDDIAVSLGSLGTRDDSSARDYRDLIADYFEGRPLNWSELPVRFRGTEFQCRVWQTTRQIPYGQTWTYGEVARACGLPLAARPVGTALAANRAGLLVPCHRVVAVGNIGGYGGWRERKRDLLRLEGVRADLSGPTPSA